MISVQHLSPPTAEELAEQDFSKVVVATLLWLYLFSCFASLQALSNLDAFDPKVHFDYSNKAWVIADRTFLNLSEQTPLFLIVLWVHAIFCDAELAGRLGIICAVARSANPIIRTIQFLLMEFSTITYYVCVNAMIVNIWSKLFYGELIKSNGILFSLAFGYYLSPLPYALGMKAFLGVLRNDSEVDSEKKED